MQTKQKREKKINITQEKKTATKENGTNRKETQANAWF